MNVNNMPIEFNVVKVFLSIHKNLFKGWLFYGAYDKNLKYLNVLKNLSNGHQKYFFSPPEGVLKFDPIDVGQKGFFQRKVLTSKFPSYRKKSYFYGYFLFEIFVCKTFLWSIPANKINLMWPFVHSCAMYNHIAKNFLTSGFSLNFKIFLNFALITIWPSDTKF